jgi:hypothetical protein
MLQPIALANRACLLWQAARKLAEILQITNFEIGRIL